MIIRCWKCSCRVLTDQTLSCLCHMSEFQPSGNRRLARKGISILYFLCQITHQQFCELQNWPRIIPTENSVFTAYISVFAGQWFCRPPIEGLQIGSDLDAEFPIYGTRKSKISCFSFFNILNNEIVKHN